jgi:hypothetical protein
MNKIDLAQKLFNLPYNSNIENDEIKYILSHIPDQENKGNYSSYEENSLEFNHDSNDQWEACFPNIKREDINNKGLTELNESIREAPSSSERVEILEKELLNNPLIRRYISLEFLKLLEIITLIGPDKINKLYLLSRHKRNLDDFFKSDNDD